MFEVDNSSEAIHMDSYDNQLLLFNPRFAAENVVQMECRLKDKGENAAGKDNVAYPMVTLKLG